MKSPLIFFLFKEHCAITFDTYTDKHRHRSFNTYTYHCVNDDWCMESRVLKTGLLVGAHTGQNLCDDYQNMLKEYRLIEKKIVNVTDSAANMILACRLIGNRRYACIAHKSNTLVQKDLMCHSAAQPLRDLIKKVRGGQSKLLYRHEALKELRDDDNQKKYALLMTELSELDDICDAETQFQNNPESDTADIPDQFQNVFTGLKSMNDIRWNCIWKVAKCYLDNQSKFRNKTIYMPFVCKIENIFSRNGDILFS